MLITFVCFYCFTLAGLKAESKLMNQNIVFFINKRKKIFINFKFQIVFIAEHKMQAW